MTNIAVTGANGNLGRRLVASLLQSASEKHTVRALVRSERAAESVRQTAESVRQTAESVRQTSNAVDVRILDYGDEEALASALVGVDSVVHLVGIIKESRGNTYQTAHENSCAALAAACASAGVGGIVYLSIVGSSATSANACLASKGRAEDILIASGVPTTVLRVPMVLGEGDFASFALTKNARSRLAFTFRASSLEQPIYAGDVVDLISGALAATGASKAVDIGGPESLARRALIHRAAYQLGTQPTVVSLPISLGMALAWCFERLIANPPVTRAMLGVLDHDDDLVGRPIGGVELTSLDDMLKKCCAKG